MQLDTHVARDSNQQQGDHEVAHELNEISDSTSSQDDVPMPTGQQLTDIEFASGDDIESDTNTSHMEPEFQPRRSSRKQITSPMEWSEIPYGWEANISIERALARAYVCRSV